MIKSPSVAVVILNWNGKELLEQFLPGVVKTIYSNLQIIVGDNASTDDSINFLKTNYPQVSIIQNSANYGFAEGYNKILEQVQADYYILLNSDVAVPQNWIEPVIALMESDDQIAAAQPKIKWHHDINKFEYAGAAGGYMDLHAFPFCRGRLFHTVEADNGQYNDSQEIFWASGAAFFVKSKNWKEVGGLDPDFFAHMEEIDVCWRLKNLGYKIVYCADAEVYHVGGGTLDANNPYKTFLNFRNNLFIMQKNMKFTEACFYIFLRIFIDFVAWLQFIFSGKKPFAMAISKAHYSFFKDIFITAKKRSSTQLPYLDHTGVYKKSVVWAYFIKKAHFFSQLKF
jgi:GT2 family glycosyltransferase